MEQFKKTFLGNERIDLVNEIILIGLLRQAQQPCASVGSLSEVEGSTQRPFTARSVP